uniref:CSON006322 protein n=1 Tax=Culicoides sonorensis TaxID=179676 RepID=A0A336KLD0_CULSO
MEGIGHQNKRKLPSYIEPRDPSIDRRYRPCPKRQVNLERVIQETCEDELNGLSVDLTDDDDSAGNEVEDNTVSVYLRLRPHPHTDNSKYQIKDDRLVVNCEETTNHFKKEISEKHYYFSKIFGQDVSQYEIYEGCIRSHLNGLLTDVGSTFITYGTSGSGKTHTLLGDYMEPGIVPRSFEQIFSQNAAYICDRPIVKLQKRIDQISLLTDEVAEHELAISQYITSQAIEDYETYEKLHDIIQKQHQFEQIENSDIQSVNVWVSFVEIYNESVRDLLDLETNRTNLRVIANDGESFIKDVQWVFAPTAKDCYAILQYGQERASYAATSINDYSSRAHSVFYINVVTISKNSEVSYANYKFCDLAGSERVKKADTQGDRLKETQRINKSLMTLGRCLTAVHANQKGRKLVDVVPVRDSKLTLLIQAALTGRERLSMIVNLLPITEYFDENLNVLSFSSIAKQIHVRKAETRMAKRQSMRFSFSINALTSPSRARVDHVQCELEQERLLDEIENYKEELNQLRAAMFDQEVALREQIVKSYDELLNKRNAEHQRKLEMVKEMTKRPYEARIEILNNKFRHLQDDYDDLSEQYELLEKENEALKKKYEEVEKT